MELFDCRVACLARSKKIVEMRLGVPFLQQPPCHVCDVDTNDGKSVAVSWMLRVTKEMTSRAGVVTSEVKEILKPQDSHPAEVSRWVVALESNVLPLLCNSWFELYVRHQVVPQRRQLSFVNLVFSIVWLQSYIFDNANQPFVSINRFHTSSKWLWESRVIFWIDFLDKEYRVNRTINDFWLDLRLNQFMWREIVEAVDEVSDLRLFW